MKMSLIQSSADLQFLDFIIYPQIQIKENSFSFIAGKSGCGKSTYLKILNRTIIPSAGTICYQGKDIQELPVLSYRKSVLLVPQEVFLFDGTIKDNFNNYFDARETERLTDEEMLKFLHICCTNFALTTDCKTLSGGEKQRVFLAIFLSCVPQVLLLDEPTAALDKKTSFELLSNIKEFCKQENITVVCICHNDELIQRFSDFTIRLGV
ncbi:ABC transporter ATP-binding protein [Anaerotignum propionicum]|jgi:putative ABC transport system ATP-binding protein|nr:ATP-binding cassette domain-containing protein [Anaerotignum propionicum]